MTAVIEQITPHHPKARDLLKSAVQEVAALYPTDGPRQAAWEKPETGMMMVAWLADEAVACGVLRQKTPEIGEIRRMYVRESHRRQGIARHILEALEDLAVDLGIETLQLRTGSRQPGAIALYERAGYRRRPCPADYAGDPLCVCLEKHPISAGIAPATT